jgi:hypothetical protein
MMHNLATLRDIHLVANHRNKLLNNGRMTDGSTTGGSTIGESMRGG